MQGRPGATPLLLGAAGQALDRASRSSHPWPRPIPTCPLPVPVLSPCPLPAAYPVLTCPLSPSCPHVSCPCLPSCPFCPYLSPHVPPTPRVLLGQVRPQCPPGSHCPPRSLSRTPSSLPPIAKQAAEPSFLCVAPRRAPLVGPDGARPLHLPRAPTPSLISWGSCDLPTLDQGKHPVLGGWQSPPPRRRPPALAACSVRTGSGRLA